MKLKVNYIPMSFEANFDNVEVLQSLKRHILTTFNLSPDAYIKNDKWVETYYISHSFDEEVREVTAKEREIMNAISILREYLRK